MYPGLYFRLCARLRQARLSEGFSEQQLAELLKEPPAFVSDYERGARVLQVDDLLRVAQYLRLDPVRLLQGAMAADANGQIAER